MDFKREIKKPDMFMQWNTTASGNPFEYFEKKFGFRPTKIVIGNEVDIEVPKGIVVLDNVMVQDKHIKLR